MVSASHTLPPTTISNASPIPSPAQNVPSIGWSYRSKAIFILLGWTLQPTVIIRELFCPRFLDFGGCSRQLRRAPLVENIAYLVFPAYPQLSLLEGGAKGGSTLITLRVSSSSSVTHHELFSHAPISSKLITQLNLGDAKPCFVNHSYSGYELWYYCLGLDGVFRNRSLRVHTRSEGGVITLITLRVSSSSSVTHHELFSHAPISSKLITQLNLGDAKPCFVNHSYAGYELWYCCLGLDGVFKTRSL
ncbi:hypothetical protein CEXT_322641 [Caerostris extrusa]|uniref:Uncharacterized protein n=1 Tax=Caerostris extrusa TaxID=172846 RepID=A0AAV4W480_CAEEX|nr:hypothetical protein CEXT_322641 [Caerostris extrusa]